MLGVLVFIFAVSCTVLADSSEQDAQKRYAEMSNKITGDSLYRGAMLTPGENFATAVYPLSVVAAITELFSAGRTNKTALKFLNLKSKKEIRRFFPAVKVKSFYDIPLGMPTLSLNAYTDKKNRFCEAFSYEYKKIFGGEIRVLDYNKPKEAANEINNQVKSQGSGAFKNIISSKMIRKGPGLHFISTYELTLKYDKMYQFTNERMIRFKSGNKVTMLPGITGRGVIKYAEIKSLDAKTIELMGEGRKYTYLIIYPNKPDGLMKILKKLRDPKLFEEIIEQGREVCAKVTLIKRDYITTIDLKRSAKESNYLNGFFEEGGLELQGATEQCNTYISSVLHQIRLKPSPTDKTGYRDNKCSCYPVEFVTDRPHLYYVTYIRKIEPIRTPVVGVVVNITAKFD